MTRLSRVLLYLIYLIMVGSLVTAIVLAFHNDQVAAPVVQTVPQAPAQPPAVKSKVASSGAASSPNSSSSNAQSNSSQAATNAGSSASSQLTNSGPGNTIGLFVVVSLAGAFAYRKHLTDILR